MATQNTKVVKCECDNMGVLQPGMSRWYDPKKELPFVNHEPGECKCTNELKQYVRNGKVIWLCSCCCCRGDVEEKE